MIYRSFLPSGTPTIAVCMGSSCRPCDYKLKVKNGIGVYERFINKIKESIKNELKKDLKCEIDDETKNELKKNIKDELTKELECKCEIDDSTKAELKKEIEEKVDRELKMKLNCDIFKKCQLEEIIDKDRCDRTGCNIGRKEGGYIEVDSSGKLYIRKIIDKFYPDLNTEIIDKIEKNVYYVKQFGVRATNCDDNGIIGSFVTLRGNMNASCVGIPTNNTYKESYNILDNKGKVTDTYVSCTNRMLFSDNSHIVSSKAYSYSNSIDKNKSIMVLSQNQSLIIADKETNRLVKKDGTISDKTLDECRAFFDANGRITDCDLEEKEDCEVCKEVIWDFPDVLPVFFL